MIYKFVQIPLAEIDFNNTDFQITTAQDIQALAASIDKVGLMIPPLLLENNNKFIIVSGFRRVQACAYLEQEFIDARILPEETSRLICIQKAVGENSFERPLNLIEISRAFNCLAQIFKPKELIKQAVNIGLPGGMAKKAMKLCCLAQPVQDGILKESIALATALELSKMQESDALEFANLFNALRFSLNKQREIITLVKEIAAREDIFVSNIFEEIHKIMADDTIDRNQTANLIRQYLKTRRFPTIVQAEKQFNNLIKQMKLKQNMRLDPPRYFEGADYKLYLTFKNLSEFKDHTKEMERLLQHPALKEIFK